MNPQTHVHHRETAERIFSELLNEHDLEAIPEFYADDCVFYGMTGPEAIDREEYASFLSMHFEAFPDLSFEIDEIVTEDDTAVVRWTAQGTHEGDLMDVPATGKTVTVAGMSLIHFEDGTAVEVYNSQDTLGLLQQLDAIPDSPGKIVRLLVGQLKGRLTDR